jgi:hypothetical protein
LSRVGVCEAWQIAFNRLIYYASYLEESSVKWTASDVQFFKDQFSAVSPLPVLFHPFLVMFKADNNQWNDLFCKSLPLWEVVARVLISRRARPNPRPTDPMRNSQLPTQIPTFSTIRRLDQSSKFHKRRNTIQSIIFNILMRREGDIGKISTRDGDAA